MTGAQRIRAAFARAAAQERAALVTYVMSGRPDPGEAAAQIVVALASAGADVVELGMPFSDPLADGPVIRAAATAALADGVTVATVLRLVRDVRALGCDVPIVLMGYVNPVLAYGIERFCRDAAASGVDGVLLPDLPLDLADELRRAAHATGLGVTFLVTPITDERRMPQLLEASTGFCYAVATTGTTGARAELDARSIELLQRLATLEHDVPVAVGFGVSTAEHVAALAPHADGVIVGSALVELVERGGDVASFVHALRSATALGRPQVSAGS